MSPDPSELVRRLSLVSGAQADPDVPLRAHTTLKVGGPAAVLVTVETVDALTEVAQVCAAREAPVLVVGKGSNLLIADDGWPGVAVVLGRGFRGVAFDGDRVVAGAAEPMPVLARKVAAEGLAGLAFGVAIPGTLGGAVRMNAGAHGGETADVLEWADTVRFAAHGRLQRFQAAELGMRYRHTDLPADAVVVRAGLHLRPADAAALDAQMDEMKRWRREHQPINEPSCGSVFRNPPGDSAGRLIDAAGMKGHRVGGATVSARHANFITVEPGATAGDVHAVIRDVRRAVREHSGIELETEVVLAGFPPEASS